MPRPTDKLTNRLAAGQVLLAILVVICCAKLFRPQKDKPELKAVGQAIREYCEKEKISNPILINGAGDTRFGYYADTDDRYSGHYENLQAVVNGICSLAGDPSKFLICEYPVSSINEAFRALGLHKPWTRVHLQSLGNPLTLVYFHRGKNCLQEVGQALSGYTKTRGLIVPLMINTTGDPRYANYAGIHHQQVLFAPDCTTVVGKTDKVVGSPQILLLSEFPVDALRTTLVDSPCQALVPWLHLQSVGDNMTLIAGKEFPARLRETCWIEEFDRLEVIRQWHSKLKQGADPGTAVARGDCGLGTNQLFAVLPGKAYRLSGRFRSAGQAPSMIYFGFIPYDKDRRLITHQSIHPIGATTMLTRPCVPSDTRIYVSDGASWAVKQWGCVAFNVDAEDTMKDLPNYKLSPPGITKIRELKCHVVADDEAVKIQKSPTSLRNVGESEWEISLSKPVGQRWPQGTLVRLHTYGGTYMYPTWGPPVVPRKWTEYVGTVFPAQASYISDNFWWPGTVWAQVLLLANQGAQEKAREMVLEIDWIKLEEVDLEDAK